MRISLFKTLATSIFLFCSFSPLLAQQVTNGEYFWDVDPGVGNGNSIAAADGTFDEVLEEVFSNSLTLPAAGLHTLNIRVQGQDGTWSAIFRQTINIINPAMPSYSMRVTEAEYFWDVDPGQGNGTIILALDGAFDEVLEDVFSNNISLPSGAGTHTFGLRIKGDDGTWSDPFYYSIFLTNQSLSTRAISVVQGEYFWDVDPGQGNGFPILALDGNFDEALEQVFDGNINLPSGTGTHKLGLRIEGVDGTWSNPFYYATYITDQSLTTRTIKVIQAEYFWNVDPGQGNGTPLLAEDGNFDEAIEYAITNSLSGVGNGIHLFNLRVRGEDNSWSDAFKQVVQIGTNSFATIDTTHCVHAGTYTVPSGDETYNISGTYNDTIPNIVGLDSIITINLTLVDPVATITPVVCDVYTSSLGNTYTSTGIYTEIVPNPGGCDSTITIDLTVNSVSDISTSTVGITISANNLGIAYQWLDCDDNYSPVPTQTTSGFWGSRVIQPME